MTTALDIDKLIECVRESPTIWDRSYELYKDRHEREQCWQAIGQVMFDEWDEMSDEEKEDHVKEIKAKWRHVRDSYLKYVHYINDVQTPNKKKKYIYAESLKFLLPTIPKRSAVKYEDGEDEFITVKLEDENSNRRRRKMRRGDGFSRTQSIINSSSNNSTMDMDQFQYQLVTTPQLDNDDPDRAFLLSVLPDYKNLDQDEKLDFRLHILNFFKELRENKKLYILSTSIPCTS